MFATYVTITAITIAMNLAIATADLARARFVLVSMASVGVPRSWLPRLATVKAAGAAGLLAGLVWLRPLGIAGGTGLALFFLTAIAWHLRARQFATIPAPAAFLAFAAASAVLAALAASG